MIKYNTALPKLNMREYGINIQQLVDHCVSIENREERTNFAYEIAEMMGRLFPELKSDDETNKKVWDHLNIISGFRLDIDFPCEVLTEQELKHNPSQIPYSKQ